jgi:transporter family-2 protein
MELLYILLALIAGSCAPTQAGINSQLSMIARSPVLAALISFAVGTVSLAVYSGATRIPWPEPRSFSNLPWWIWTGGCLGAFLVAVTILVASRLGAATLMASMVAGQMAASLVLDHYGLVGYSVRPISLWRIVGVILLVAGVIIIRKF